MFSDAKEAVGEEVFRVNRSVILDVAAVIGRVGKDAIRSVRGEIQFFEVFNCLAALNHAVDTSRYITNASSEIEFRSTAWDTARLAGFMDLITRDKVDGLTPNQHERESLRFLSVTLRNTNEQHNIHSQRH